MQNQGTVLYISVRLTGEVWFQSALLVDHLLVHTPGIFYELLFSVAGARRSLRQRRVLVYEANESSECVRNDLFLLFISNTRYA